MLIKKKLIKYDLICTNKLMLVLNAKPCTSSYCLRVAMSTVTHYCDGRVRGNPNLKAPF